MAAEPAYPPPTRLSYPEEEKRYSWMSMLLDVYFTTDKGVHEGVRRQVQKGRSLACFKGCSSCCRSHTTIPVYPLEITGLYWYAINEIKGEVRDKLIEQLKDHKSGEPCPMLVDGACSVHPMRPQACRHFNVFDTPCADGEDAFYTRRQDVLTPIKKYKDEALSKMLPFHDITSRSQRREAIKSGLIHSYVQVLQEIEWFKLAERMIKHTV